MKYYEKEMPTIHPDGCHAITWEDAEAIEKKNAECGWGLSIFDMLRVLADHMEASDGFSRTNDEEAEKTIESIEWRLEDANFHTFCDLLKTHEYGKALDGIHETYSYEFDHLYKEEN